jgi:hypothetical protein
MDRPAAGRDDKWKLSSSKGRSRSGRPHATMDSSSSASSSSAAAAGGTGGGLSRSYSASVATTRAGAGAEQQQQQQREEERQKKKCVAEVVKEHRARFYIVRRCVSMLVCWRDY